MSDKANYRKRTNIGDTLNLAIEHQIAKLKITNIKVARRNEMASYAQTPN